MLGVRCSGIIGFSRRYTSVRAINKKWDRFHLLSGVLFLDIYYSLVAQTNP